MRVIARVMVFVHLMTRVMLVSLVLAFVVCNPRVNPKPLFPKLLLPGG